MGGQDWVKGVGVVGTEWKMYAFGLDVGGEGVGVPEPAEVMKAASK